MSEDLDNLKRQADAALAEFADKLSLEPSDAVVDHVKSAVKHALSEQWLAGQPMPTPSSETLRKVRGSVHRELERATPPAGRELVARRWPWLWARPALAVAAAVALAFGVARFARRPAVSPLPPRNGNPPTQDADDTADRVDLLVDAANDLLEHEELVGSIESDLNAIETSLTQWPPTAGGDVAAISELLDQVDTLLTEAESGRNTSRADPAQQGAVG